MRCVNIDVAWGGEFECKANNAIKEHIVRAFALIFHVIFAFFCCQCALCKGNAWHPSWIIWSWRVWIFKSYLGKYWTLQITMDLVALALYDVILYCDDSGSMAFEENVSLRIHKLLGWYRAKAPQYIEHKSYEYIWIAYTLISNRLNFAHSLSTIRGCLTKGTSACPEYRYRSIDVAGTSLFALTLSMYQLDALGFVCRGRELMTWRWLLGAQLMQPRCLTQMVSMYASWMRQLKGTT